jgi:hypothetical protein
MSSQWRVIFSVVDPEDDRLDVLAAPGVESLILRRNSDEAQTVELGRDDVVGLMAALSRWRGSHAIHTT